MFSRMYKNLVRTEFNITNLKDASENGIARLLSQINIIRKYSSKYVRFLNANY